MRVRPEEVRELHIEAIRVAGDVAVGVGDPEAQAAELGEVVRVVGVDLGRLHTRVLERFDGAELDAGRVLDVPAVVGEGEEARRVLGLQREGLVAERAVVAVLDLGGQADAGTRLGDLYAYVWEPAGAAGPDPDNVSLFRFDGSVVEELFTLVLSDVAEAHPTLDGGLFAIDFGGTLFHYDAGGDLVAVWSTPATNTDFITLDPSSGKLAVATRRGVVSIIDPATGDTQQLPALEPLGNLAFGRDGELLVLTGLDGTVRLWDVERSASAGVAWAGSGAVGGSPSWYDAESMSVWVATSGRVLKIPLDPAHWIARACEVVGRDLSQEVWDRSVPGTEQRQSACGRTIVDDDAENAPSAEAIAGPTIVIETVIDFDSGTGTFEVTTGSDALGCSSGTVIETGGPGGIINELTCEEGGGGTVTIQWQIDDRAAGPGDVNGPWSVIDATGDFAGALGEGLWSGTDAGPTGRGTFDGVVDLGAGS